MGSSRILGFVILVLLVSGCGLQRDATVYDVPPDEAFKLLNRSDLAITAFGHSRSSSFTTALNEIIWRSVSRDKIDCIITLDPAGESSVDISVNCGSGPDQSTALDPITVNQLRQDAIEMIDATLTGRAFDRSRKGETAYRWPKNKGDLSARKAASAPSAGQGYGPPPVPDDWREL